MAISNFDQVLSKVNGAISLPQMDRSTYAKDFENIRDEMISKLKAADSLFEQLYSGTCMAGSYADNLKISKPDEYDLLICLKLRENPKVKVTRSKNMPGYVKINMSEALDKMKFETQNKFFWERFQKYVNSDGFLIQDKIQSWFESLMTKILLECKNTIKKGNKTYDIRYTKAGPAHTLNINGKSFSIDFVPAFVFTKQQWAVERPCPNYINGDKADWFAVPKPLKGQNKLNNNGPNLNFIASLNKIERQLIYGKDNLKNTLKMLKKIRDRLNIQNLKSYFIKTVYLWENEKQPSEFWQQSTTVVLMHMFEKLCDSVKDGKILFFWDRGHNMLQPLGPNQLNSMHGQLKRAFDDLNKYRNSNPDKIYDLFLTEEEKAKLSLKIICNDVVDNVIENIKKMKVSSNQKSTNNFENDKILNRAIQSNNCNKNTAQGGNITTRQFATVAIDKSCNANKEEHAKKIVNEIQKLMNNKTLTNVDKVMAITNECSKLSHNVEPSNQKTGFFSLFNFS